MPIIKQKLTTRKSLIKKTSATKFDFTNNSDSSFNSIKPSYSDYDIQLRTKFNSDPDEFFRVITRQKKYSNRRQLSFPKKSLIKYSHLLKIFLNRRSERTYKDSKKIPLTKLGILLKYSAGVHFYNKRYFRTLPSGGQRYPLEIYVILFNSKNKKSVSTTAEIYHYDVLGHCLDLVQTNLDITHIKKIFVSDQIYAISASAIILVTGVIERTSIKYRRSAEKIVFSELGHLGQNLWLISTLLNIKFFPTSAIWERPFYKIMNLNPSQERFMSAFILSGA